MPRLCGSRLDLCAFLRRARTYGVYIGHLSTVVGLCTANDLPFLPPVYTHLVLKFLFGGRERERGMGKIGCLCARFFFLLSTWSSRQHMCTGRQTDRQTDNMTPTHTQRNKNYLIKRVIPARLSTGQWSLI